MTKTKVEIWDKIYNRISKGWCQGSMFLDADGNPAQGIKDIDKVCLWGAIIVECQNATNPNGPVNSMDLEFEYKDYIRKVLPGQYNRSIPTFNDDHTTEKGDVLAVVRKAKELAIANGDAK